jgi:hypothetical protein
VLSSEAVCEVNAPGEAFEEVLQPEEDLGDRGYSLLQVLPHKSLAQACGHLTFSGDPRQVSATLVGNSLTQSSSPAPQPHGEVRVRKAIQWHRFAAPNHPEVDDRISVKYKVTADDGSDASWDWYDGIVRSVSKGADLMDYDGGDDDIVLSVTFNGPEGGAEGTTRTERATTEEVINKATKKSLISHRTTAPSYERAPAFADDLSSQQSAAYERVASIDPARLKEVYTRRGPDVKIAIMAVRSFRGEDNEVPLLNARAWRRSMRRRRCWWNRRRWRPQKEKEVRTSSNKIERVQTALPATIAEQVLFLANARWKCFADFPNSTGSWRSVRSRQPAFEACMEGGDIFNTRMVGVGTH